jgi:hypothetical protein
MTSIMRAFGRRVPLLLGETERRRASSSSAASGVGRARMISHPRPSAAHFFSSGRCESISLRISSMSSSRDSWSSSIARKRAGVMRRFGGPPPLPPGGVPPASARRGAWNGRKALELTSQLCFRSRTVASAFAACAAERELRAIQRRRTWSAYAVRGASRPSATPGEAPPQVRLGSLGSVRGCPLTGTTCASTEGAVGCSV